MMKTPKFPVLSPSFSLTNRVMLFVAMSTTISLLIIGISIKSAVSHHFKQQDAEELEVITKAVIKSFTQIESKESSQAKLDNAITGHHGVYFQIWNENKDLLYGPEALRSREQVFATNAKETIQIAHLEQWEKDGHVYRGITTSFSDKGKQYRVAAAIDMGFHVHFLDGFSYTLWIVMALAGVLTLLAGWLGVHQGLAPLRTLGDAMQKVNPDKLDVYMNTDDVPEELVGLVKSFNLMTSRLKESFEKLTNFSSDIAHELRTPLANIITQTQVGLGKHRDLEEYKELLYSNLEEMERLAKMINEMLWIAKSDNGLITIEKSQINLHQEVSTIKDFFEALLEENEITLSFQMDAPSLEFDRAMLQRTLSNLISNAIRYTEPGNTIAIKSWETLESIYIAVENPGSDIPAEYLPKLFDRFYRIDPSRQKGTEGTGLGLSIVRAIVVAHGGSINATSGDGLTSFVMNFPKPYIEKRG